MSAYIIFIKIKITEKYHQDAAIAIVTFLRQEYFTLVTCRTFMYQLKHHNQNRDYHIFHCHHRKAYNNIGIILRSGQSGLLGFELELGLKGVVSGEGPKHLPP